MYSGHSRNGPATFVPIIYVLVCFFYFLFPPISPPYCERKYLCSSNTEFTVPAPELLTCEPGGGGKGAVVGAWGAGVGGDVVPGG